MPWHSSYAGEEVGRDTLESIHLPRILGLGDEKISALVQRAEKALVGLKEKWFEYRLIDARKTLQSLLDRVQAGEYVLHGPKTEIDSWVEALRANAGIIGSAYLVDKTLGELSTKIAESELDYLFENVDKKFDVVIKHDKQVR